ncbi:MAG TPA: extracellular solute-binding protein [Capillibacterium sp.]
MKIKKVLISLLLLVGLLQCLAVEAARVELTLWDWHAPRMQITEKYIKEYEKLNPGVKINQQTIGWDDYWKKLTAGIAAKKVPDIASFHNSKTSVFLGQLAPYPQDRFPLQEMEKNIVNFKAGYVFDGQFYFYPVGIMSSLIFYNKDLWKAAGLTEADRPRTWDDFVKVAKKLTKYDKNGKVQVAGFGLNGALGLLWCDLNYQKGGTLYNEDGTATRFNTEAGREALTFLRKLVFEEKVTEPGFLDYSESLGTGNAAMVYGWTWLRGSLDTNFPDLNYAAFPLPTFTGELSPGPNARNNHEVGFCVPKAVPEARKQEAWKFLDWLYHDTDYIVESCLTLAVAPADKNLWADRRIQQDPIISELVKAIPYTIIPGELPEIVETTGGIKTINDLTFNGAPVEDVLRQADREATEVLKQRPVKWCVEKEYKVLELY